MGKTCANVPKESAAHVISGFFTAVNLRTDKDVDYYDTFCPVSEYIPKSAVNCPEKIQSWFSINNGKKNFLDLHIFKT